MAYEETSREDYIQLFNEIVEQQSIVLGPDIATIIAKKVEGLTFSDGKKIIGYEGDAQQILQNLIDGYVNLSGMIVRKTIEPLLAKHPSALKIGGVAAVPGEQSSNSA